MQRHQRSAPRISSTNIRIRSLRSLFFFSFFPSSMETSSFSSSIGPTNASSASPDPRKETFSEASDDGDSAKKFGFQRAEFRRDPLVGTVQLYDRHLFLRYKSPELWLPNVEGPESDHVPRLLAAAMKDRKDDMKKKTRLTICGATDSADTSEGDVLIFPEMIGYRGLTDGDIENFVDLVLVKDTEYLSGAVETLTGSYIFVCAHGSRDQRCGVCGPDLIEKFKEEISLRDLDGQVFVSPCSHIGGHKYAGNVIIFSQSKTGQVSGNWYGYVCPDDVPMLLEQQIGKGEIIDHLWRGQMGLSVEEQKKAQSIRCQPNIPNEEDRASGCCQGNGNLSCCQNTTDKPHSNHKENNSISCSKITDKKKNFTMPTWLEPPKPGTYATLAFAVTIASVSCAFFYYRNRRW